jgi:DNA-binding Lrp family transcriptional regulator
MDKSEKKQALNQDEELHAIVLVALSSIAYRDPQKTAKRLAKYKEVESVDILTGNWDLALEVKIETPEALYDFLKRTIFKEDEIVKTNSLISLKRIKHSSS